MSRFEKPTFISSGLGITLASANCNATWSGPFEGYWSLPCGLAGSPINTHADESVQSAEAQAYALHYIRTHERRFWRVELARLGRAFGAFHPLVPDRARLLRRDTPVPLGARRPGHVLRCSLALALGGTVVLRRRRVPVFPLWALGLDVVATVLLSFGNTRYRTPFEVALALLAAVQLDVPSGPRRGARAHPPTWSKGARGQDLTGAQSADGHGKSTGAAGGVAGATVEPGRRRGCTGAGLRRETGGAPPTTPTGP